MCDTILYWLFPSCTTPTCCTSFGEDFTKTFCLRNAVQKFFFPLLNGATIAILAPEVCHSPV